MLRVVSSEFARQNILGYECSPSIEPLKAHDNIIEEAQRGFGQKISSGLHYKASLQPARYRSNYLSPNKISISPF